MVRPRVTTVSRKGYRPTQRGLLQERRLDFITLGHDDSPRFFEEHLIGYQPQKRAVSIKNSSRWYDCFPLPDSGNGWEWKIPYINKVGKYTGHTVYRWNCAPQAALATIISTISKRLLFYARRHNKLHVVRRNYKRIVGAAYLYAVTKNAWFMDRILFFLRKLEERGNLIHKFTLKFLVKQDEYIRFVYSQVLLQTNWLLSQARRPCDKSSRFVRPTDPPQSGSPGRLQRSIYLVKALDRAINI